MDWWQALILGIVEGLTEYLPVSSTGHLILTAWLLGFGDDPQRWKATFAFNIVIQAGAIAAVAGLYWRRCRQMILGLMGKDPAGLKLAIRLVVAFLPAAVLGLGLHDVIQSKLNGPWPVVGALAVGGVVMIVIGFKWRAIERHARSEVEDVTIWMALVIGLAQCVAMWPGTSRSLMTIVAALLLGMRAKAAAEFSFLLGLITLGAATSYEGLKDGPLMIDHFGPWAIVVGFAASTVFAALAVKWFVSFLTRHGLGPFGWYRLVIAGAFAIPLLLGWMSLPRTGVERSASASLTPLGRPLPKAGQRERSVQGTNESSTKSTLVSDPDRSDARYWR